MSTKTELKSRMDWREWKPRLFLAGYWYWQTNQERSGRFGRLRIARGQAGQVRPNRSHGLKYVEIPLAYGKVQRADFEQALERLERGE